VRNIFKFISLLLIFLIIKCSVPHEPVRERIEAVPEIKIGLISTSATVSFTLSTNCYLLSHDGEFITRNINGSMWEAEVMEAHPAESVYMLVFASMSSLSNAKDLATDISQRGFETAILPHGKNISAFGKIIVKNRLYRVCLRKYFKDIKNPFLKIWILLLLPNIWMLKERLF